MEVVKSAKGTPVMGYALGSGLTLSAPPGAAAILTHRTRRCAGVITSAWVWDADDVAEVDIFLDQARARVGTGVEGGILFIDELFAAGVSRVQMHVLDFNRHVLSLLRKGKTTTGTLRQYRFVGGRFADVHVFIWTANDWRQATRRLWRYPSER
jgi:RimJ/RimL family protein N-acetyltransferase